MSLQRKAFASLYPKRKPSGGVKPQNRLVSQVQSIPIPTEDVTNRGRKYVVDPLSLDEKKRQSDVKSCLFSTVDIHENGLEETPMLSIDVSSADYNGTQIASGTHEPLQICVAADEYHMFFSRGNALIDKMVMPRQSIRAVYISSDFSGVVMVLTGNYGFISIKLAMCDRSLYDYLDSGKQAWGLRTLDLVTYANLKKLHDQQEEKRSNPHNDYSTSIGPLSDSEDEENTLKNGAEDVLSSGLPVLPSIPEIRKKLTRSVSRHAAENNLLSPMFSSDGDTTKADEDDEFMLDEVPEELRQTPASFEPPLRYSVNAEKKFIISYNDFKTLYNNDWINDTIIDFFIAYEMEKAVHELRSIQQSDVYAFNSFFFTKLYTKTEKQEVPPYYENIRRWLAKVDLMSYNSVIIPINEHLHWYCVIIKNLPELLQYARNVQAHTQEPGEEKVARPYVDIITIDSLKQSHSYLGSPFKEVIKQYCQETHNVDIPTDLIRTRVARVSRQRNFNDCGIHVIFNVRKWLEAPAACEQVWKSHSKAKFFSAAERNGLRKACIDMFLALHSQQTLENNGAPSQGSDDVHSDGEIELISYSETAPIDDKEGDKECDNKGDKEDDKEGDNNVLEAEHFAPQPQAQVEEMSDNVPKSDNVEDTPQIPQFTNNQLELLLAGDLEPAPKSAPDIEPDVELEHEIQDEPEPLVQVEPSFVPIVKSTHSEKFDIAHIIWSEPEQTPRDTPKRPVAEAPKHSPEPEHWHPPLNPPKHSVKNEPEYLPRKEPIPESKLSERHTQESPKASHISIPKRSHSSPKQYPNISNGDKSSRKTGDIKVKGPSRSDLFDPKHKKVAREIRPTPSFIPAKTLDPRASKADPFSVEEPQRNWNREVPILHPQLKRSLFKSDLTKRTVEFCNSIFLDHSRRFVGDKLDKLILLIVEYNLSNMAEDILRSQNLENKLHHAIEDQGGPMDEPFVIEDPEDVITLDADDSSGELNKSVGELSISTPKHFEFSKKESTPEATRKFLKQNEGQTFSPISHKTRSRTRQPSDDSGSDLEIVDDSRLVSDTSLVLSPLREKHADFSNKRVDTSHDRFLDTDSSETDNFPVQTEEIQAEEIQAEEAEEIPTEEIETEDIQEIQEQTPTEHYHTESFPTELGTENILTLKVTQKVSPKTPSISKTVLPLRIRTGYSRSGRPLAKEDSNDVTEVVHLSEEEDPLSEDDLLGDVSTSSVSWPTNPLKKRKVEEKSNAGKRIGPRRWI